MTWRPNLLKPSSLHYRTLIGGNEEPRICQISGSEVRSWFITGEQQAQAAMIQLERYKNILLYNFHYGEQGAVVESNSANQIKNLTPLLVKLANAGFHIFNE